MATVYLAQDLKHERQVAIKVLREDLSASLGAGRFLREVKIAAQLQHPHILPLLDSGEADGFLFFVMPYIKGQSLRERLAREGELPVHEAVRLLTEVVDALVEAHAHGVVHRDIKPDNVMLSGRHALVTDFGVAKAISEATGRNTITTLGVAVGTPTYMSPEQAAADPNVDHRSDIYSVGVMAYEMLSGRPPFTGATPQQVLAAHVTEAPDSVAKRRPAIPASIEAVVMRCLAKRPADRFQTAAELYAALEPLATPSGGLTPTATVPHQAAVTPTRSRRGALLAVVGVLAVAGVAGVLLSRRGDPVMVLGTATQVSAESPGLKMQPAISADGEWVAYAAGTTTYSKIFVRRIGGGRPIALTDDTVSVEQQPRFSPDGKQILFLTRGGVAIAPAQGGQAAPLVPGPDVEDANWSPTGDRVAYVRRDSLLVRSQNGERAQLIARLPGLHACQWSPDGALFACTLGQNNYAVDKTDFGNHSPTSIVTIPAAGGPITFVTDSSGFNLSPVWGAARQLYFVRDQNHQRDIFAVTVTAAGQARGTPVRITSGLGALGLGLTPDGHHLVYTKYSSRANIWSLPITTDKVQSIADAVPVTAGDQTIESMRVSRDGQWLLFDSDLSGTSNIFRVPVAGGSQEQLTQDSTQDFAPDLSPDGKAIAFHSWRTGTRDIFVLPLDGGPLQQVTRSAGSESYPVWSPDGKSLVFIDQALGSTVVVTRLPDGRWGTPSERMVGAAGRDWSPDGRFLLALRGTDSSVVVVPADSGSGRLVSRLQALSPVVTTVEAHWNADGQRIFVKLTSVGTTRFWSVPLAGGTPTLLAQLTDPFRTGDRRDFAVDRSKLYFALTDRQSDLWVVDLRKP